MIKGQLPTIPLIAAMVILFKIPLIVAIVVLFTITLIEAMMVHCQKLLTTRGINSRATTRDTNNRASTTTSLLNMAEKVMLNKS